MNKKGTEVVEKAIFWTIMMSLITILIVFFVFAMQGYREKLYELPGEFEGEFISSRFLASSDCLAYQDNFTSEVYSGVIDLEKFTSEQIQKCYYTGEEEGYKYFNFELTLPEFNRSIETNDYFNYAHFTYHKNVLVWDGIEFVSTKMLIYVNEGI